MTTRRPWSSDELVATLSLYCRLPFGKFHRGNGSVVALAEAIDRTPSAVAMKLGNFATFDPEHQRRGIVGLANTSRLDRETWDAFYGRWELLANRPELEDSPEDETSGSTARVVTHLRAEFTQATGEVMQRRGQAFFRQAVLAAHEGTCCVTGLQHPALLRASHIIPWAANAERRLDPSNGLCLGAFHDAAFDRGLMSVAADGTLLFVRELESYMPPEVHEHFVACFAGKPIRPAHRFRPDEEALAYHRAHVFREVA